VDPKACSSYLLKVFFGEDLNVLALCQIGSLIFFVWDQIRLHQADLNDLARFAKVKSAVGRCLGGL